MDLARRVATCAAHYAPAIGRLDAEPNLRNRIHQLLAIAQASDYESLVLGDLGCGAFTNDPKQAAIDFRATMEGQLTGAFGHVIFAATN
ncbi:hypothetical protein [Allorhodopirellula heiligendammensis]|uniref:Uncharacterized protein n=1 Tax=Allorhodopirellula heiligendammensis TaxID=2714739 RepID=A0A5C6C302_9BACT|nr:hypothetical protein [Allorhodopirellula heiligendammensis]TWU18863.1 hypothetical protein Poly21_10300 [Allorhodopirellula heiligendammensis]